ncbi:MAG: hypothetical protein JNN06_03285 [Gemmobacter sp.]|uniref:hypothetical protein n=1 Tax=Gemmobacter sp. TaxID=1898957 RepID=UPI001A584543|nr:hypothetical protein [Gemmobacter sp.]MBL8561282.1 hypothetical protein [Gemmobacter sp.]
MTKLILHPFDAPAPEAVEADIDDVAAAAEADGLLPGDVVALVVEEGAPWPPKDLAAHAGPRRGQ